MNIENLKSYPIPSYLESKGEKPHRSRGNCLFYRAFWRGGDNPENVKVDTEKNLWFDYGAGVGGSVIDLVAQVENLTIPEAMAFIRDGMEGNTPIKYKIPDGEDEAGIQVLAVGNIFYFPIKEYCRERGISEKVASEYCKEIHFRFGDSGKECFGLAFRTISGGYIIRNRQLKVCTAQDISLISVSGSAAYMVFEGFFDFLSYVEMYGHPRINAIVLNSVTNIRRCYRYFDTAKTVYLMLDNDQKGREETGKLVERYGGKIVDKSGHFAPYKDFNEYLRKGER